MSARMRLSSTFCFFAISFISVAPSVTLAGADPRTIDDSIARAKKWLYSQQSDGNWEKSYSWEEEHGDQATGFTALATYALLSAGESHQHPRIQQAVDYLLKNDTTGVYALGLRCQVWLLLPQSAEIKSAMRKDAKILVDSIHKEGKGAGFYGYNPGKRPYSHSRGHYGVLGVWAAAQAGVEVPDSYWQLVEKSWIANQDPSGGWTYQARGHTDHPLTPNMTASAVATLFITQDYLHANEGIGCKGNITNPAIDKGMKWLTDNFDKIASDTKYPRDYPYNTMYGLERVGVASGYKYIGDKDWFAHGAEWLLRKQRNDGSWPSEYGNVTSTSFALIFLARGRAPVAINKLDYSAALTDPKQRSDPNKQAPWNQRPRDVANLVHWVGRQSERELNWQIVNLNAPLKDLFDAPILYISGNQVLNFSDEFKSKLKQYIEQGGLVIGNADCQGKGFANTFRKLGQELFPQYEFRELPAEHPIYTNQQFHRSKWKSKPSVLAMSNGVRELMILFPQADPGKSWQLQITGGRDEMWQVGANIFFYAIDKQNLRSKGETYLIDRWVSIRPNRTIKLARLQYDGNWDPEPAGWKRLSNLMHNRFKTELDVQPVKLEDGSLEGFSVAHLTGTTKLTFSDSARAQIRQFVESGGTLIIDAAGGSSDFAQSAEAELSAMFPQSKPKVIGPDHAVFAAGGSALKRFEYRPFAQRVLGSLKDAPRLALVEVANGPAVFFSREDLSAGLVGQPIDGVVGYTPETASEIMARLVLFADE